MATTTATTAPAPAAVVTGGGPATTTTTQSIFGSHVFRIDGFSKTKDLGVGESIESTPFRVGGHAWFIRCYPCGVDKGRSGCVSLDHPAAEDQVEAKFTFTLIMDHVGDTDHESALETPCTLSRKNVSEGVDFMEREELEPLLKDDCFEVRCGVLILIKEFHSVPPLDIDTTETVAAGSHVLTVDGYSRTTAVSFGPDEYIESHMFSVGGHSWFIELYPCGEPYGFFSDCITAYLCRAYGIDEVKVRLEMSLLNLAGEMIASSRTVHTFSATCNKYRSYALLEKMEVKSSPLLADGFLVRCDIAVVNGITALRRPNLHRHLGGLLASPVVGGDVTFEVGGDQLTAHKCVLAARSSVFMAELFGPGKHAQDDNNTAPTHVRIRIDDMEPRVFKALLHFIYTDTLPAAGEEGDDKVAMSQGLLVAADRYGMEGLKLICGDMLCRYIDASTALTTLQLAQRHGCPRLHEACMKFLNDILTETRKRQRRF